MFSHIFDHTVAAFHNLLGRKAVSFFAFSDFLYLALSCAKDRIIMIQSSVPKGHNVTEWGMEYIDIFNILTDIAAFDIEIIFSSNETVYSADVLISDWSGIAFEYAFATQKPVLFIGCV